MIKNIPVVLMLLGIALTPSKLFAASFENNRLTSKIQINEREFGEINIKKRSLENREKYKKQQVLFWGGDEVYIPREIIDSIVIKRKGEGIFLPFSAFSDLGDPRDISFKYIKNNFLIIIHGGDAAGSYQATLTLKNGRLIKKRVVSNEFPDQVWTESKYSFIPEDSKM
jgi:hypothetical protein